MARNIARADALIKEAGLREGEVDLLVGPELAFSGECCFGLFCVFVCVYVWGVGEVCISGKNERGEPLPDTAE